MTAIRTRLREIPNDLPVSHREHPGYFDLPEGDAPLPVTAPILGGKL